MLAASLHLRLEPVGDPRPFDHPAISNAHEYPAAGCIGKGYKFFVQVGQGILELDLLTFALFQNLLQLLLIHPASTSFRIALNKIDAIHDMPKEHHRIFLHIIGTWSAIFLPLKQ